LLSKSILNIKNRYRILIGRVNALVFNMFSGGTRSS